MAATASGRFKRLPDRFPTSFATMLKGAALLAMASAGGCATGKPLEVKKVDAAVQPPANVALYLKVRREDGQPVTLLAKDFKVYEDGKQIPPKKLRRALLPVSYAVDRFVFVVVDLSGPLVDSEYLSTLQDAVTSLADRVGKDARMALSAFDGDGLVPFIEFDGHDPKAGLAAMRKFRPRSRNIDLWGTFISALDALDAAKKASPVAHQHATLILVTDRRDKAGRHSRDEALTRVQKSAADVFVIGIGESINREELEPLGKTGAFFAAEARSLDKPFVDLADRVESNLGHDYLFSYCASPPPKGVKRGAKRTVEVRIATSQWRGEVEHEFSTKGFSKADCDPSDKPAFGAARAAKGDPDGTSTSDEDAEDDPAPKAKAKKKKAKPAPDGDEEEPVAES